MQRAAVASHVKGGSVAPHWMADGNSFWYAEQRPGGTVVWKVDPVANTTSPFEVAAEHTTRRQPGSNTGPKVQLTR